MDRRVFFLGVLAYLMSCCLAADYVTVSNDVKVKPSEPGNQVDVTLNCTGSRSEYSFYIRNSIRWEVFRKTDGRKNILTQSFNQASNSEYAAEHFGSGHLEFQYSQDTGTSLFVFCLTIKGVTHADNGVYRCSLLNEANNETDSKDVKLTVVNPVESLSLQLHSMTHSVLAQSSSPITEGDKMLEITPGQYMVSCDASGSNPEPVMSLYYNDDKLYVSVDVKEKADGDRMHYTGSFHMDSITLQASSSPQELTCTANIQGSFFPATIAGISLLVQSDKPMVNCEIATARLGDSHAKLMCTLSAEGFEDNLYCDKVSWHLSKINRNIQSGERWSDETKAYDIIEANCEKTSEGLKVSLELYTVTEALFNETYFMEYGIGENAHRHPVILYADKLKVDCENVTARLGDSHVKLMCTLSAERSRYNLYCDKVSWHLIKINQTIQSGESWSDETKAYDIIEANCEKTIEGLEVSLELYTVTEALFDETYFVEYGIGENAHRHPIILYAVTPAGATMITRSLPAIGFIVAALVSKLLTSL